MIQTADLGGPQSFEEAAERVTQRFIERVGYRNTQSETGLAEAYVKAS